MYLGFGTYPISHFEYLRLDVVLLLILKKQAGVVAVVASRPGGVTASTKKEASPYTLRQKV